MEIDDAKQMDAYRFDTSDVDALRQELKALSEKNLNEATFDDMRDLISNLDIKVYPSEDLKAMHIKCGVNLQVEAKASDYSITRCGKIIFAPLKGTKPRTPRQLRRDSIWPGRIFSVTFIWPPLR